MKRLLCLLLVSGFMFSFADVKKPDGTKLEPRRTVIAGVVENYTEDAKVLIVNFGDCFSGEKEYLQNIIESGGQFQAEHDYLFVQDMYIKVGKGFIPAFVTPGDSIFIRIDAAKIHDDLENAVRFSGDNAERNEELFRWSCHSRHIFRDLWFDSDCPPERFWLSVEEKLQIVRDSIDAYDRRIGMSDFLKKWAFINKKFEVANCFEPENFREFGFRETLDALDMFDENNFQSSMFQIDLGVFNGLFTRDDAGIKKLLFEADYLPMLRMIIDKVCGVTPKGIVRDNMLFSPIDYCIDKMPELYDSLPEIKTIFSNDFCIEKLKKTADRAKSDEEKSIKGMVYFNGEEIEKLPDVKFMNYLAEKHKDKIVYIDIWATWCVPCLKEIINNVPELHEKFKGKDVVFVNLCMKSKQDQWLQRIKNLNMGGENYCLDDDDYISELFQQDNNFKGFPSYLIIDKEGKLHNPVPRPSELAEAIKKIESLLK